MDDIGSVEPACPAAANHKGEHIPCQLEPPHDGWAHQNTDYELVWSSAGVGSSWTDLGSGPGNTSGQPGFIQVTPSGVWMR